MPIWNPFCFIISALSPHFRGRNVTASITAIGEYELSGMWLEVRYGSGSIISPRLWQTYTTWHRGNYTYKILDEWKSRVYVTLAG